MVTTEVNAQRRYPRLRTGKRAIIPLHIRLGVFMRDGFMCVTCGYYGPKGHGLHLDHIQPWSFYGPDTSENLRTLCAACNEKRSNFRIVEDGRRVLPIAGGCLECQPSDEYDGLHDYGTLAYCAACQCVSYSQLVDSCWMQIGCDCGGRKW